MNASKAGVTVDKLIVLLYLLRMKSIRGRHLRGETVHDYVRRVRAVIGPKYWGWDSSLGESDER